MSEGNIITRFVNERRRLGREMIRIVSVDTDAHILVEELKRRRDGETPRSLDLPALRAALDEVEGRVS